MLKFVNDPCVIDCLVSILFHKRDEYYGTDKKIKALQTIADSRFMENVITAIKSPVSEISNGGIELLYRIIEEARMFESSEILFKDFQFDLNGFTGPRALVDTVHALFLKRYLFLIQCWCFGSSSTNTAICAAIVGIKTENDAYSFLQFTSFNRLVQRPQSS